MEETEKEELLKQLKQAKQELQEQRFKLHEEKNQAAYAVEYLQEQSSHKIWYSWKKKKELKEELAKKQEEQKALTLRQENEIKNLKQKVSYLEEKCKAAGLSIEE